MTREEAKETIKYILKVIPKEPPTECDNIEEWLCEDDEIRKALDIAIKSLEQEPCEDAISRKKVMNQIFYSTDNSGDVVLGSNLRKRIEELPPVTLTRKKGKWIRHEERKPLKYGYELIIKGKCSNCGEVFCETYKMKYCPNCGSLMSKGVKNE